MSEHGRTLKSIVKEWEPELSQKSGSPTRLAGLQVYYDFDWSNVIGHRMAQFRNGQDLARCVTEACPDEETACLLLTTREDVHDGPLHTDDKNYVFVVRIQRYLEEAHARAAGSYLMRQVGVDSINVVREVRKAVSNPHRQDEILEMSVDKESLSRWAGRKQGRYAMLREIGGDRPMPTLRTGEGVSFSEAAIGEWINSEGPDAARAVATQLSRTPEGRRATAMVDPAHNLTEDVRSAVNGYSELVTKQSVSETDVHRYLKNNPLLLGLEYAEVMSNVRLAKAELDFVVRRHDGYRDVLELKGPSEPIIDFNGEHDAHPSAYKIAPKLARSLAQIQLYRERIATSSSNDRELYGVTRDPRFTIVIGRDRDLPNETARKILRQLNVALHRTKVLPYDILSKRVEAQLKNLLDHS